MAMEWQDPHDFAKHLKRAATPAGFRMWQLLRNRQRCGAKFRREYVKEPYILDFYCPEAKLCIECDLLHHLTPVPRGPIKAIACSRRSYRIDSVLQSLLHRLLGSVLDQRRRLLERADYFWGDESSSAFHRLRGSGGRGG